MNPSPQKKGISTSWWSYRSSLKARDKFVHTQTNSNENLSCKGEIPLQIYK